MVIVDGATVDDVHELLKNDIYAVSGVWDLEKTTIIPVSCCLSTDPWHGVNDLA